MPYSVQWKNAALDAAPPDALSLHSANPGSTGASELSGGSPAYARKTPTWSAAATGSKALSGTVVFDVPASTVAFVGMWRSGVWQGYIDVTDEVYAGQGTYTITSGTLDLNATASA